MREHHQRHVRPHGGAERHQLALLEHGARHGNRDGSVVGVDRGRAQAGKVLGGGRHARAAQAGHGSRRARGHLARPAGEGPSAQRRRARGHVGHRGQVHVHAESAQLAAGVASEGAHLGRAALLRLPRLRPGDLQRANLAALLVHGDQGAPPGPALHGPGECPPLLRRAPVAAEQDHPRRLTGLQAAAEVGRHGRAVEARDEHLADLLAQRQALHRLLRSLSQSRIAVARRVGPVGAHGHPHRERQGGRGAERQQPAPRGGVRRQVHGADQPAGACAAAGLPGAPAAPSAMPAWRLPSTSASRPKPSAGPSAPVPWSSPAAARSAPQARIFPVNV